MARSELQTDHVMSFVLTSYRIPAGEASLNITCLNSECIQKQCIRGLEILRYSLKSQHFDHQNWTRSYQNSGRILSYLGNLIRFCRDRVVVDIINFIDEFWSLHQQCSCVP